MSDKNLPVYKLVISENPESDLEVNYVALVDRPAIEKNFQAFREQRAFKFSADEEKRIITGPLILTDLPIYRNTDGQEYYVVFDADTVMQIAQKFFEKGYQKNVNLMHDQKQQLPGLVMFESWITDPERGIAPMAGYEDAKPGSWFGSFKVNDDETWQLIKSGEVKGFSVEGLFGYVEIDEEQTLRELEALMGSDHPLIQEVKKLLA